MSEDSGKSLEQRLSEIEDRLNIYNLIAMHPLSADGGDPDIIRAIYSDDIKLDRGDVGGSDGIAAFAASIQSDAHREAIEGGMAHLPTMPLVELVDDATAYATSYVAICRYEKGVEARLLPNHGYSKGFSIFRIVVNRWHLAKRGGKWYITARHLYPMDGTLPAQELIQRAKSIIGAI